MTDPYENASFSFISMPITDEVSSYLSIQRRQIMYLGKFMYDVEHIQLSRPHHILHCNGPDGIKRPFVVPWYYYQSICIFSSNFAYNAYTEVIV
jgi:hypothetical protein